MVFFKAILKTPLSILQPMNLIIVPLQTKLFILCWFVSEHKSLRPLTNPTYCSIGFETGCKPYLFNLEIFVLILTTVAHLFLSHGISF